MGNKGPATQQQQNDIKERSITEGTTFGKKIRNIKQIDLQKQAGKLWQPPTPPSWGYIYTRLMLAEKKRQNTYEREEKHHLSGHNPVTWRGYSYMAETVRYRCRRYQNKLVKLEALECFGSRYECKVGKCYNCYIHCNEPLEPEIITRPVFDKSEMIAGGNKLEEKYFEEW